MSAEGDRVTERFHEHLAVGTGAEMAANLLAHIRSQFIVYIGGQSLQYLQAPAGLVLVGGLPLLTSSL
jgi:hypothetical protein